MFADIFWGESKRSFEQVPLTGREINILRAAIGEWLITIVMKGGGFPA